ncbi:MAG: TonB-dependent receptor [Fluviicola sp.]|nr:TonB-dependent receptor [Fluviicola sp.]
MTNYIKSILIAFTLLLSVTTFGQQMSISGTVYDSTGVKPVENAIAMAIRMKDSLLLGFTRTAADGTFTLTGFEVDTFSLIIDHGSFDEKIYYMFGHAENAEIEIPSIKLPSKAQEIQEVVIYANRNPIFYRGDTLVYVADSFKVHEGAVVEDLLKKLPGLTVDKDGKITSQGQAIDKVLVDGDEFFGTDPTIATKNLGADGIETVQIYEKEDDDGIGGDGDKIKVLDLKLKDSAKKGYFGRISGATDFGVTPVAGVIGTNPFFEGEMLLNKFDGAQKISIFALGSNTPRSNFSRGDMSKFGLSNEEGAGRRFWEDGTTNSSGIPQTVKAGIYFSDKFGEKKKIEFSTNYSYYNTQLLQTSASRSQYFLRDTTYFTDDSTSNNFRSESHRFNMRFFAPLDSLTTIEIKPSFRFDVGTTDDTELTDFVGITGFQSLRTSINNGTDSRGYTIDGMARINRKFKKKKRELELRYDIDVSDNKTAGKLKTVSSYFFASVDSIIDQQNTNNNSEISHYGTATYIEPLAKKLRLELQYLYEYGFSDQKKETFDGANETYTSYRADLSNTFDNIRQQHRGSVRFLYNGKKHNIYIGSRLRNIDILNVNRITDTTIRQNFTNILPRIRYEYKPSMSKRFSIAYRTSSSQPSITDLAPVPDNSNPNRIQVGNPDLIPNYTHTINASFNTWKAMTGQYFWSGANLNITNDAFATRTDYDIYGRTISKTVNVDGNLFAVIYAGAGMPFWGRKMTIRPSMNSSFNRYTNLIGPLENVTDNFAISGDLTFAFQFDSLEFSVNGSQSYTSPTSSLSSVSNTPFTTTKVGGDITWRLPKGFVISTDAEYTRNAQEGEGFYNLEFFVWNAELSKSFLKTNNLVIALVGKDLLNQNINASRQVNGNIVTDYRTTIISRYFLLKATLRFNNRKAKEEDYNGMF